MEPPKLWKTVEEETKYSSKESVRKKYTTILDSWKSQHSQDLCTISFISFSLFILAQRVKRIIKNTAITAVNVHRAKIRGKS